MEDDRNTITVDNRGGKGNPHHKPAGSPEGGQFTSADGSAAQSVSTKTPKETGEFRKWNDSYDVNDEDDFDFDMEDDFDMELDDMEDDYADFEIERQPFQYGKYGPEFEQVLNNAFNLYETIAGYRKWDSYRELHRLLKEGLKKDDWYRILTDEGLSRSVRDYFYSCHTDPKRVKFVHGRNASLLKQAGFAKLAEPEPIETAIEKVNPNYSTIGGKAWTWNCQRCVQAALARFVYGFDVEAMPRLEGNQESISGVKGIGWSTAMFESSATGSEWWDENIGFQRFKGKKVSSIEKEVMERISSEKDENAFYFVYMAWQGTNSAHVFNAMKRGNEITMPDFQTHSKDTRKYRFQSGVFMPSYFRLMRADTLLIRPDYLKRVMQASKKEKQQ